MGNLWMAELYKADVVVKDPTCRRIVKNLSPRRRVGIAAGACDQSFSEHHEDSGP